MARAHDEGAERGETYLRLMAEACLRRAPTYPPYDGPARALPSGPVPAALSAPVAAVLRAALPGARALRRAAQPLAPAAGQVAHTLGPLGNRAASALTPLAWRAAHTVRRLQHPPRRFRAPPAMEDASRVRAVADALVAAGVLDETTAASITAALHSGLALRSRAEPRAVYAPYRPFPLSSAPLRAGPGVAGHAPAAGTVLAVPIGVTMPAPPDPGRSGPPGSPGPDGRQRTWHLLSLVLPPGEAILTVATHEHRHQGPEGHQTGRPTAGYEHWRGGPGVRRTGRAVARRWVGPPSGPLTAVDDRSVTYRFDPAHETFDGEWGVARFRASPGPPPGTRWLDITAAHWADPARVTLPASPAPAGTARDLRGPQDSPGPRETLLPGEWALDNIAGMLLWQSVCEAGADDRALDGLTETVAALETAGALPPGSPAVGRLAALARRLGVDLPASFAGRAVAELPGPWQNVLSERHRRDGPVGVAPAAAVLPDIGGSRFVIAGLRSGAVAASLHVLAWGWEPNPGHTRGNGLDVIWCAHDDAGRWHTMAVTSASRDEQGASFELTLVPPLHPAATSLEVIVTGREAQARVTVPLGWQGVAG